MSAEKDGLNRILKAVWNLWWKISVRYFMGAFWIVHKILKMFVNNVYKTCRSLYIYIKSSHEHIFFVHLNLSYIYFFLLRIKGSTK